MFFSNIRNMYVAFRPVILLQVVNDSVITILLSSIIIMVKYYFVSEKLFVIMFIIIVVIYLWNLYIFKNYYNGMSLASFISLKFIGSSLIRTVHLFMICYLFANVNEQVRKIFYSIFFSFCTILSWS